MQHVFISHKNIVMTQQYIYKILESIAFISERDALMKMRNILIRIPRFF